MKKQYFTGLVFWLGITTVGMAASAPPLVLSPGSGFNQEGLKK